MKLNAVMECRVNPTSRLLYYAIIQKYYGGYHARYDEGGAHLRL